MQLALDFEPGLTERYATLMDAVRAQAYGCGRPLKAVAADMDLSQSELSRKLAQNDADPRRFTVEDLERFIPATGSYLVIHWLIERHLEDRDARRERAVVELQRQLPALMALLKAATQEIPK